MAIFLSYRRLDSATQLPQRIHHKMKAAFNDGLVFLDVDSIVAGSDWASEIDTALAASRALVFLAGPSFGEAAERTRLGERQSIIRHELQTARSMGSVILPVYWGWEPLQTGNATWPKGLEWLDTLQWTRLGPEGTEPELDNLVRQVGARLASAFVERLPTPPGVVSLIDSVLRSTSSERLALDRSLHDLTDRLGVDPVAAASLVGALRLVDPRYCEWERTTTTVRATEVHVPPQTAPVLVGLLLIARQRLDGVTRQRLYDVRSYLADSRTDVAEDELLRSFVLLAIDRALERQLRQDRGTQRQLEQFRSGVKKLAKADGERIRATTSTLLTSGILQVADEDKQAFLGSGDLKKTVKQFRRPPRGGTPRGGTPRSTGGRRR